MALIPDSEVLNSRKYYLPHHWVRKDDSTTTKLRVVFNASATDSESRSVNDYLEKGPKLQKDLMKLLLKFRVYPIALTGDLEKNVSSDPCE
ncbi:hypothetical protein AVEN_131525-1 [Araneus ventricosus]|uniref:Uncharacterized protein n=1 Tax=Araneus ventricosus TaxID=182803 RepID=A0A4Y2X666_ARAVE|nr:hypothetical protein AVEN_253937-1 [Araneus ventricosus]GBO44337.1 hypothetical protein AVEN_131525-1 [Araneus ventricosus]